MRTTRAPLLLAVVISSICLLSGCTADPEVPATTTTAAQVDNPWIEVAQCLDDAGFPGFVADESGVIAPPGSSGDEKQFALLIEAEAQCADQAGFYDGPIPTDELPRLYALELEEIECLRDLGYELPSDPPTLQTYVDNTAQGIPWEALLEVFNSLALTEQTEEVYTLMNSTCPPPAARFTRD